MSDDGIAEIMREMERNALRLQNGIKLAMGMEFVRVGPTPKQTVWSSGKVELWRYDTEPGAVKYRPPILLVPSVVSRSYVFDLHAGNSFVERLLGAGFDVYLVDWGVAGKEESTNTFETYVDEHLPAVVAAACADAGTDEVTMLGYCFSGLLTMLYLARHPDAPIRSLVALAPPIDYAASEGITKVFAEGRLEPDEILDEDGNVPGDVVREAFAMRKPTSDLVTNAALWDNLWKDDYVEGHQAMAQFIREQVPLPGALLRQIVTKLIRGNELATGETELAAARSPCGTSPARCWWSWPSATSRPRGVDADPPSLWDEHGGTDTPRGPCRPYHRPQGRHGDDPPHRRVDRGSQPRTAGE